MDETSITQYIIDMFDDIQIETTEGVTFFFYGPDHRFPFATIVTQDNDYDHASKLKPGDSLR